MIRQSGWMLAAALLFSPAWAEEEAAESLRHWPTLSYEGTLLLHGKPVTSRGAHFKLTLYDAAEAGNPVWVERLTRSHKVKVEDGDLSMITGRVSSLVDGELLSEAAPKALWLEVTLMQIDRHTVGEMMGPRIPISTKPFAFACTQPTRLTGSTYTLDLRCVPDEGRPVSARESN